jgi:hypothetical protein
MNLSEFKNKISLIFSFTIKMNQEAVCNSIQEIFIKLYANSLNINLTDKMINNIIEFSAI